MFSVSFIVRPGTYDEFRRLDAATEVVAERTEGYLGSGTWWSDDRAVCNAVCCWDDWRGGLQSLTAWAWWPPRMGPERKGWSSTLYLFRPRWPRSPVRPPDHRALLCPGASDTSRRR